MGLEDKLFTIKYSPDTTSHLNADKLDCINCKNRVCEHICPAKVYEWDENNEKLIINYENCMECGACRIACKHIQWEYPKGTKGVMYKLG